MELLQVAGLIESLAAEVYHGGCLVHVPLKSPAHSLSVRRVTMCGRFRPLADSVLSRVCVPLGLDTGRTRANPGRAGINSRLG